MEGECAPCRWLKWVDVLVYSTGNTFQISQRSEKTTAFPPSAPSLSARIPTFINQPPLRTPPILTLLTPTRLEIQIANPCLNSPRARTRNLQFRKYQHIENSGAGKRTFRNSVQSLNVIAVKNACASKSASRTPTGSNVSCKCFKRCNSRDLGSHRIS